MPNISISTITSQMSWDPSSYRIQQLRQRHTEHKSTLNLHQLNFFPESSRSKTLTSTSNITGQRLLACSHKPAVVLHPLMCTTLRLLLLVLLGNLGRLTTHLSGTGQRSVNLTCRVPETKIQSIPTNPRTWVSQPRHPSRHGNCSKYYRKIPEKEKAQHKKLKEKTNS